MKAKINEQDVSSAPQIVLQEGSPDALLLNPKYLKIESLLVNSSTKFVQAGGASGGGDGGGEDPADRPSLDDIIGWKYERKAAPGGATVVTLKIKFRNSSGKVIKGFDAKVPQI